MIKVKTFSTQLKIFHMMNELQDLDKEVNNFIAANDIRKVISASDAIATGKDGETIGLTRLLAYDDE